MAGMAKARGAEIVQKVTVAMKDEAYSEQRQRWDDDRWHFNRQEVKLLFI